MIRPLRTLFAVLALAALAPSQQPPIRMLFDMHRDPIPNGAPPAVRMQLYQASLDYGNWVLDTVEPYGVKLSFLGTGMFMEIVAGGGYSGNGATFLRRVYASGGQIGTHSHTEHRLAALNWPDYPFGATLAQSTDAWQDAVTWVDHAIDTAFANAPPEPLATINCVRGSHLPSNEPDFHVLMAQFGFLQRQGGPEEDYYGWYGHHIWNPFRPSAANAMGEDLGAPFVLPTQGSVIGLAQVHHNVFQDMTAPAIKRQFLQLYVNWRYRDRHALPAKIWTWGWGSHNEDYAPNSASRAALLDVVPWLDQHFASRVEPSGSPVMLWSTQREAGDAYRAWEAAHPGVSSFSFDALAVDWNEYPYLRPVAEELQDFLWSADLDLGAGVDAFHLTKGGDDALLVWRDSGTSNVTLPAFLAANARVVGLETGLHYGANAGTLAVAQEPLLVTELARCSAPVSYCASTVNSSGAAATIEALGSISVAANAFALRAAGCTADSSALFICGAGTKQQPFGDGFLCVRSQLTRLVPVTATDATGTLTRALDLTAPDVPVGAGSIWNFQCWFRDSAAGGSGANLSNGVNVRFCP